MKKTTNENKKSYKKPLVLGAIAVLLTIIGVAGGNTYAKYITSKTANSTTATVAKWGYVISGDATDLFATDYSEGTGANADVMVAAASTGTGIAATGTTNRQDVVAPGSKGSATITVSGVAEVAATLSVSVSITNEVNYNDYKPVKWTLTSGTQTWSYDQTVSPAVNTLTGSGVNISFNLEPGENSKSFTLTWEWAFETGTGAAVTTNNAKDTILGYRAAYDAESDTTKRNNIVAAALGVAKDSGLVADSVNTDPNFLAEATSTTVGVSMTATIAQRMA